MENVVKDNAAGVQINGQVIGKEVINGTLNTFEEEERDGKLFEVVRDPSGNIIAEQEITVVAPKLKKVKLDSPVNIAGDTKVGVEIEISEERLAISKKEAQRKLARNAIKAKVGDTDALVGTATDGVHLLLHHFITFLEEVSNAKDIKAVQKSASDILKEFGTGAEGIKAADMPFERAGVENTLNKIAERAHETSKVLKE